MEFEKAMREAEQYLTFSARFIDPKAPQGLWFCDSVTDVSAIQINAVCLGSGCDWDDIPKCKAFIQAFPYLVIVIPNAIAREAVVEQLRPRLPATCIYVIQDSGFRHCASIAEFIRTYGERDLLSILEGAVELPAYGLLLLSEIKPQDMSTIPRTLSRFKLLDSGIAGFFAGELSIWTGKRGIGKSTILSQILLEALDQGHPVCAYSGELDKDQFREWTYLQAAGPQHIAYRTDKLTGKRVAAADPLADARISEWMGDRYVLFDLEANTSHDPENILSQFEYAHMRYGADVFLVDNIMTVSFRNYKDRDFYRAQSDFGLQLSRFAKRHKVHVHLVVHPRKSTGDELSKLSADDVGGSGDLTNAANNVFFLTTHAVDDGGKIAQKPILKILKNRRFGAKGQQWLDFDRKSRRFFVDKTGDPNRPYGWDPSAQQITLTEDRGDIDEVFPEEDKKQ